MVHLEIMGVASTYLSRGRDPNRGLNEGRPAWKSQADPALLKLMIRKTVTRTKRSITAVPDLKPL